MLHSHDTIMLTMLIRNLTTSRNACFMLRLSQYSPDYEVVNRRPSYA